MKLLFTGLVFLLCIAMQTFAQEKLIDLRNFEELQKQFTSDGVKVRIVALLSPT